MDFFWKIFCKVKLVRIIIPNEINNDQNDINGKFMLHVGYLGTCERYHEIFCRGKQQGNSTKGILKIGEILFCREIKKNIFHGIPIEKVCTAKEGNDFNAGVVKYHYVICIASTVHTRFTHIQGQKHFFSLGDKYEYVAYLYPGFVTSCFEYKIFQNCPKCPK